MTDHTVRAVVADDGEARAAFQLRLRARGIQDRDVLRALELVGRENFVAHRYADLAGRDIALPIGCGQSVPEAWFTGRMIEALAPGRHHRVLEIGTGSGYTTAILAHLAREVVSIERFQGLAIEARARLERRDVRNATVVWADGLSVPTEMGRFDRVIAHGSLEAIPPELFAALGTGGVMIAARPAAEAASRRLLVRLERGAAGDLSETMICSCRLPALLGGIARAL